MTRHVCTYCQMVITLYQQGLSALQVGAKVGLSHTTVRSLLIRHGIPRRPRGARPGSMLTPWAEQAVALRAEGGRSCSDIARSVGVTRERVRQVLVARGVDTAASARGHRCDDLCDWLRAQAQPVPLSLAIARQRGVILERLLRRARAHGVSYVAVGGNRHICDARCERMREGLAAGLSIRQAAIRSGTSIPVGYTQRQTQHPDWPWPRREWWLRAGATLPQHVCTERCETFRAALASGASISAAARAAGTSSAQAYRLPSHHPDWPWPVRNGVVRRREAEAPA